MEVLFCMFLVGLAIVVVGYLTIDVERNVDKRELEAAHQQRIKKAHGKSPKLKLRPKPLYRFMDYE